MATKKPEKLSARNADRYALYLASVQDPGHEVKILSRVYRDAFGQDARVLREDFCGTAAVCGEWVRQGKDRVAYGVDLDPEPLAWGRAHHLLELSPSQLERVHLLREDVRSAAEVKADVVAAQNFSFFIFRTRAQLRDYFAHAYANLADRGAFLLDMMGGPLCYQPGRIERRRLHGFTYVWEQEFFDPISHETAFHISFEFRDGTRMKHAFSYPWRMWTMKEVTEVLEEVGFSSTVVYWHEDYTSEGSPIYRRKTKGVGDPVWLTYVVGIKGRAAARARRPAAPSRPA